MVSRAMYYTSYVLKDGLIDSASNTKSHALPLILIDPQHQSHVIWKYVHETVY